MRSIIFVVEEIRSPRNVISTYEIISFFIILSSKNSKGFSALFYLHYLYNFSLSSSHFSYQDTTKTSAGDICALFGVDCSSGDTFVAENSPLVSMESIFVPEPVISLAVEPKNKVGISTVDFSKI